MAILAILAPNLKMVLMIVFHHSRRKKKRVKVIKNKKSVRNCPNQKEPGSFWMAHWKIIRTLDKN